MTVSGRGHLDPALLLHRHQGQHRGDHDQTLLIDDTAPVTTATVSASYVSSATIALVASDALSGIASTEYRLDDGEWTSGTVVFTDRDRLHTAQYRSRDAAGNTETVELGDL